MRNPHEPPRSIPWRSDDFPHGPNGDPPPRRLFRAGEAAKPGAKAGDVYRTWQDVVDRAGLAGYQRHHCGYAVGIGFPPSWSGSGTPRGLRTGSDLELREGMVFHLMSWLLRTGRGDFFLSDTILIGPEGAEFLTQVPRGVNVVR